MPSVAAWLLARPHNAIIALAFATMLMPGFQAIGTAILVLVALQLGYRRGLLVAAAAGALIIPAALVFMPTLKGFLLPTALVWSVAIALSEAMRSAKSLTLALQLAVLVSVVGTALFYLFVQDPVVFWQMIVAANPMAEELNTGLEQWQTALGVSDRHFAGLMTTGLALGYWMWLVIALLIGYALYQKLPDNKSRFGRFSDLNYGRVIALLLAITAVAGFLIDVVWIQNASLILFVAFLLQGAAMVHWLHRMEKIPTLAVAGMYVLSIVLIQFVPSAIAVLGYTDAWFDFRSRVMKQQ